MVPISKRMKAIADMVPEGLSVADIGCDHGFVSIYLVTERQAPLAVAMDVNEGPLIRAKEHIEQYCLTDKIHTRLSDGAKELNKNEVQSAVIAGMGGRLTIKILNDSSDKFKAMKSIVLSPHSDISLVREYLSSEGYIIDDEEMVYDEGKYYVIMRCNYSGDVITLDKLSMDFGPVLLKKKHPVLKEYIQKEILKMTEIAESLSEEKQAKRIQEIKDTLLGLNEVLKIVG